MAVLLAGNAGEVAFAIIGSALTGRSPLNARQLLLVNMLTDALPATALAVSSLNEQAAHGGHGPDERALWRTVAVRGVTTASAAVARGELASGGLPGVRSGFHGGAGALGGRPVGADVAELT